VQVGSTQEAVTTVAQGHPRSRNGQRAFPTVGLFSGIGGLELGLARAGHETSLACEVDPTAQAVLEERFQSNLHDDIRTLRSLPKSTELLVGGFPCQDLSQAGRTAGIRGARSGLVGEVFRLLERKRVPWVVLENVPFMLQLSQGRALEVIVQAFEALGYRWAYRVVDSRAFGLPQRRRRVLFIASREEDPRTVLFADESEPAKRRTRRRAAHGFYWTEGLRGLGWAVDAIPTLKGGSTIGCPSPPGIWMPDDSIGTPTLTDSERLQGFATNWTRPAETVARQSFRWKLVGNAVSVPVAKWLGGRLAKPGPFRISGVQPVIGGRAWPTNAWNVGQGRFTGDVSEWPKAFKTKRLDEFLNDDLKPLSHRATAGFVGRLKRSNLRLEDGFLDALEAHLERFAWT